jgi:hypothetical protein
LLQEVRTKDKNRAGGKTEDDEEEKGQNAKETKK